MAVPDRAPFAHLSDFVQSVQWPVMPEAGQALIRTLNDDDADTFSVCRIIKKDPALTAALLRMANSAMFGLSGTVSTLERAVSVVGIATVRTRAISMCMARACVFPTGMDRKRFWHYSLLCAGYAQWLADLCEVDDQEAWLCGMMLRLGGLSLVQVRPERLLAIEALPAAPGERWMRQRSLLGFDEGEVTGELAAHWDFPAALVTGLRQSAQPLLGNPVAPLPGVVHLAARLADSGAVTANSIEELPLILLTLLKLDAGRLAASPPDEAALTDVSMLIS